MLAIVSAFAAKAGASEAQEERTRCAGPDATTVSGDEIADKLRKGEKVFYENVVVRDNDNVTVGRDVFSVETPVVLINSTVEGNWSTPFVDFQAPVNFRNTCFRGDFDIYSSHFNSDSDFSEAQFGGTLTAGVAQFAHLLDLGYVTVAGDVSFDRATFDGGIYAVLADFGGRTGFTRASFSGASDFSRAQFRGNTSFVEATETGDLDFSLSHFCVDDSCIRPTPVPGEAEPTAYNFDGLTVGGTLNFTAAKFDAQTILTNVTAARLKMRDAFFGNELNFRNAAPTALEMDIDTVLDKLESDEDRIDALQRIEATARSDGEITLANEASFKRQVIKNEGRFLPCRWLGWFFGEQVAGYTVKPLRPLRAMLFVVGIAIVLRSVIRAKRENPRLGGLARKTFWPWLALVGNAVGASLVIAINPKPPNVSLLPGKKEASEVGLAAARWAEWGIQKALNAVLVIAVGNAIPGAKEIIDAILKR